jgi:hypothetical protein
VTATGTSSHFKRSREDGANRAQTETSQARQDTRRAGRATSIATLPLTESASCLRSASVRARRVRLCGQRQHPAQFGRFGRQSKQCDSRWGRHHICTPNPLIIRPSAIGGRNSYHRVPFSRCGVRASGPASSCPPRTFSRTSSAIAALSPRTRRSCPCCAPVTAWRAGTLAGAASKRARARGSAT